jgi:hypothetical protein
MRSTRYVAFRNAPGNPGSGVSRFGRIATAGSPRSGSSPRAAKIAVPPYAALLVLLVLFTTGRAAAAEVDRSVSADAPPAAPMAPEPPSWVYEVPPPPPPFVVPHKLELGVGLRGDAVITDRRRRSSASLALGGVGVSVRPRFRESFALDIGADFITGTDYNGFERTEEILSLQPMFFFSRRNRILPYLTAGISMSRATVDQPLEEVTYHHIGGDFGGGIEIRLGPHTALDLDGIFFIRTRTDSDGKPEFLDPATGRTTDTSGGALLRATFLVYFSR